MRAAVSAGLGVVAVQEVPDPVLEGARDAIIRVTCAGICGSDLHFFHGKAPLEVGEVMGHEAVGVVEALGEDVRSVGVGQRVVVSFVIVCGRCWFCLHGQSGLCEDFRNLGAGVFGGGLGGAQAERLLVPDADTNLLAIPDDVPDSSAVFVGDVLATAVYGTHLAAVEPGEVVAVIGAGPVGLLTAAVLESSGAGQVAVLDRDERRLDVVPRLSGAMAIHVERRNAEMAIADLTEGRGADVVIEAVGTVEAFESGSDLVRRGGRIVVLGMYTGEVLEVQLGVWWARGLQVTFAGVTPVHAWWHEAMHLLEGGGVDPRPLISDELSLDEAAEGYRRFDARESSKVILRP